ncbi:peptidyl-prolyl cis-trans isomerase FKBP16-4, chloroplastic isoform X2 [Cinnamomum micranthum f. kanehirae]|uniref:peptidylprolyl isomerase n=1 Tax=Cinnamomum micranthum f. kanehirae TaxID=337451 RepID=A0A443PNE3_9MAGN|nr:peptidyl-prolyl cis-trans isomerase FKBP16-4, chloroplastic isoform X2 [Cinnamomum micranthum f. kanehirae]
MELSLFPSPLKSLCSTPRRRPFQRKLRMMPYCSSSDASSSVTVGYEGRRRLLGSLLSAAAGICTCDIAAAVSTSRRALRGAKVPESEFTELPNGLKYYDLKVGSGAEAVKGSRVAVHYVARWKGVTFMTSRQGIGVTGGTPYGFDVGQSEKGNVLKGLDLGVQGMRVGGQLDIELLSIKQSPFGTGVKLVEG